MDKREQISVIMEPVRKIVLTGNSMRPNKKDSVLIHVKRYIIEERRQALKLKKSTGQNEENKENKDDDGTEDSSIMYSKGGGDLIRISANGKFGVEFAEYSVREWEEQSADLIKLIVEGKGKEIVKSLVASLELTSVCLESVVFCLVLVIKKARHDDECLRGVVEAYKQVPRICKTTQLLMLFIQYCKIYTLAKVFRSGWGRGLKSAVRNWYLKWEPKDLALEVTRNKCAYTWSHKDLLKLAHISMKDLPLGHAVVLNYVFSGYESTKKKYETDPKAADILLILDVLHEGASEIENTYVITERGNNLLNTFGAISLRDFPYQALEHVPVLSFMLNNGSPNLIIESFRSSCLIKLANRKPSILTHLCTRLKTGNFAKDLDIFNALLAYNAGRRIVSELVRPNLETRSKKWRKHAQPNPDRHKKIKLHSPRTAEIDELFKTISQIITIGTKDMSKNCENRPVVFIDFDMTLEVYVPAIPEDLIAKQVRASQAISYLLLALGTNNLSSLIPLCRDTIDKFNIPNVDCNFASLLSSLNKYIRTTTKLVVSTCLDLAIEMKSSTALLIYCKLDEKVAIEIREKYYEVKGRNPTKKLRVIVLVIDAPTNSSNLKKFEEKDIIFLYGFNRYTVPVIQAYTNGLL